MNLTTLENQALAALQSESANNGHSFGLIECVKWADRKQLGGLVTSLQNKGVITEVEVAEVNDGERWTQYVLAERYRA